MQELLNYFHGESCSIFIRKPWMQAVATSSNPGKDFARALTVLVGCIKPCILLPVWTDSLGHTRLRKSSLQGKEEKKRTDRRDKKEREEEEERLKPWMTWVRVCGNNYKQQHGCGSFFRNFCNFYRIRRRNKYG